MSWYQQDIQALVDLLAEETEQYTRHFISGKISVAADHKAVIDALIIEIRRRKNGEVKEPPQQLQISPNDHLPESSI